MQQLAVRDQALKNELARWYVEAYWARRKEREGLGFQEIASYLVSSEVHGRCEPDPERHELYEQMMSRQQYLVDTLHPAGFL